MSSLKPKPLIAWSNCNVLSSSFLQTSPFFRVEKDFMIKMGALAVLGCSFLVLIKLIVVEARVICKEVLTFG